MTIDNNDTDLEASDTCVRNYLLSLIELMRSVEMSFEVCSDSGMILGGDNQWCIVHRTDKVQIKCIYRST